jgi:hypothetical protein
MRRSLAVPAFLFLVACGSEQQSCDYGGPYTPDPPPPRDPRTLAVPTRGSGPGRITFTNSSPVPGSTIGGCGPALEGCAGRLKLVFGLRADVPLVAQRLRLAFYAEDQAHLECASSVFDLEPGQAFAVEVACPAASPSATLPLRVAVLIAETGSGAARIEQAWNVPFVFAP